MGIQDEIFELDFRKFFSGMRDWITPILPLTTRMWERTYLGRTDGHHQEWNEREIRFFLKQRRVNKTLRTT